MFEYALVTFKFLRLWTNRFRCNLRWFYFVDFGGGGVVLRVAVVGIGSGVVCSNMLSILPVTVIPSSVRY